MKRGHVYIAKRVMDVTFSIVLSLLAVPAFLFIAISVKLTSRGPIFYRQRRMGMLAGSRNAPMFYVLKFRTMKTDAEAGCGAVLAGKNDNRVTRLGGFLRKTRLDELPQLINVIRGEMSLVGPRPERPELMVALTQAVPFFEERLRFVKPGITGLAQVNLKYDGAMSHDDKLFPLKPSLVNPYKLPDMEDSPADGMRLKLLYDMAYSASLESFSSFLLTDLAIIFKTPYIMFVRRTGR